MKIRIFLWVMAAVLLVTAGGAGCQSGREDELNRNRRLWGKAAFGDYRYELRVLCFCPPEITDPVIVEVRGGMAISVKYAGTGLAVTNSNFTKYDTLDKMFQVIEDSISQEADEIKVEYHPDLGYPTRIDIDFIKLAADDEISYTISNFSPLP